MDATPALWIVFLVALFIATFDNGEIPKYLTMLGVRGVVNRLGSYVGGLLLSLYHTPHAPRIIRTLPVSNTTGRQAERGQGE